MLKDQKLAAAGAYLPQNIQKALENIPPREQALCEEIRLREGKALSANIAGVESVVSPPIIIDKQCLTRLVETASRSSVYAAQDTMKSGYITLEGGHRLGLCGRVVSKNGEASSLQDISSASLRIAREITGVSDKIFPSLARGGFESTLIISPPGLGKTTLLRDLIRALSRSGLRVRVADERGELAGTQEGIAQFDLGPSSDVIDRAPKSAGMLMLLKNMSPQVIAVDEVTSTEDIYTMKTASYCGVSLLASAHAEDTASLARRPLYRELIELKIFRRAVVIRLSGGKREYILEEI